MLMVSLESNEVDPFGLLYRAKWNVPTAAKALGVSDEECKQLFRDYCARVWADEEACDAKKAHKSGPKG